MAAGRSRRLAALVTSLLAWALALLAGVATCLRWLDVAHTPVVLVQALNPLAAAAAGIALLGVCVPGPKPVRLALGMSCVLVLAVHATLWLPWLTTEDPSRGRPVTVMTASLKNGNGDAPAISRIVRAHDVDLLVLTEVRNGGDQSLRAAGVYQRLPHSLPRRPIEPGTLIRSRLPLDPVPSTTSAGQTRVSPRHPAARLDLGRHLTFRAAHPVPPVPGLVPRWRRDLRALSTWAHDTPGPLIMAGDFNSSVDHPAMRELLAADLRDAHEVAGAGRPRTWPNARSVPPFVHIDHVLVRGLDVTSAKTVRIRGTDHYSVIASLILPEAS